MYTNELLDRMGGWLTDNPGGWYCYYHYFGGEHQERWWGYRGWNF